MSEVILKFRDLIEKLEKDVYAVLRLEKEEKEMVQSEAQVSGLHLKKKKNPHDRFVSCLAFYVRKLYVWFLD